MCYGKADDMNWKNYYRRDDIYLPVYRVLYGFVAAGSSFSYDLAMDIYLDHVRAKKIYNGEM